MKEPRMDKATRALTPNRTIGAALLLTAGASLAFAMDSSRNMVTSRVEGSAQKSALKAPSKTVRPTSAIATFSGSQALKSYEVQFPNSVVKMKMIEIPGGSVTIGGKSVNVKPFYIAESETPWEMFDLFLNSGDPSKPYDQTNFAPDAIARPSKSYILPDLGWGHRGWATINVSFTTVDMFCRWMSSVTGKKYRLPTEAEWELAARGGAKGAFKMSKDEVEAVAWYEDNADGTAQPIKKKQPNAYGLYDILGNVGEWATDLEGKPVLCGPCFEDPLKDVNWSLRKRFDPSWQESDPQSPKSRWWLADGAFCGFRVVCEG